MFLLMLLPVSVGASGTAVVALLLALRLATE